MTVTVLIISILMYFSATAGWKVIIRRLEYINAVFFIPFYGSFRRFKLAGKQGLFIPYVAARVIMAADFALALCMYMGFLYIPIIQTEAKPLVVIFLAAGYVFYVVSSLCAHAADTVVLAKFQISKDDAVPLSFFPWVFAPLMAYQISRGRKTQKQNKINNSRFAR